MRLSEFPIRIGSGLLSSTLTVATLFALGTADNSARAQPLPLPKSSHPGFPSSILEVRPIRSSIAVPLISSAISVVDDSLNPNLASLNNSGSIEVSQTNNPLGFTPVDLFPDILDNAASLSTANLNDNAVLTSDNYSKPELKWNLVLSLANQIDSNNRNGTNPFAANLSTIRTDIASANFVSNNSATGLASTITQFGNASFPHSLEVLNALLTANNSSVAAATQLTSTTGNLVSLGANPDLTFSPVPEPPYMIATCALMGLMFAAFRRKTSHVCL